jgi:hypothetical protein
MIGCDARIAPVFNGLVVFATTGTPGSVDMPEGMSRNSLALYHYTNGRPAKISELLVPGIGSWPDVTD